MGYTRGGAPLYGRLLLALARSLRLQPREYLTTRPLREAGAEADAATVDPVAALAQCLAVVTLDGAHDWNVLHEALLERTQLSMAEAEALGSSSSPGDEVARAAAVAAAVSSKEPG